MFRRVSRWLALGFLAVSAVHAQTDPFCADVAKAAAEVVTRTGVPSASVAVVRQGRIACVLAVGDARIDPKTPAAASMRYSIGSVSKQFTAAAILMLAEDWRFLTVGADQQSLSPKGPSPLVKERDAVHQLSGCPDRVQRQLQLLPLGGQRQSAHSG